VEAPPHVSIRRAELAPRPERPSEEPFMVHQTR
jgi:hypothetical protein